MGSYQVFKDIGQVIPTEKHPLPRYFEEQCDFIVTRADVELSHRINLQPEVLELVLDAIEKTIEFKSHCLSKADLFLKL